MLTTDGFPSWDETRGSIIKGREGQLGRIMVYLGRMTHDARVAKLQRLTGDDSITSTNDLSEAQAEDVLRQLEGA